jgi:outer membrane protein W
MRLTTAVALTLAIGLSGAEAAAQEYFVGISYGAATPLSDTKDFTNSVSFRGLGVEGRAVLNPNVTVGLAFGWNVFDDQVSTVAAVGPADVSGTQFRYINAFPLLANAHYYFGRPGGVRPYVGGNIGAYAMERRTDLGLYGVDNTTWHFGLAPEAGFVVPAGLVSLFLNTRYNYAAAAGDLGSQSYWGFNIGIAWLSDPY